MDYTYTAIDLSGALKNNIDEIKRGLNKNCAVMAVVKANAYGHGMIEVAQAALKSGVSSLAVARPHEGEALREAGIDSDILVLGAALECNVRAIVLNGLTQTVFSPEICEALSREAVLLNKPCRVHIKVDTGMNRLGLSSVDEFTSLLSLISSLPGISAQGVYTHFAQSEIEDKSFTMRQLESFSPFAQIAKREGMKIHCANSGAIIDMADETAFDMVRAGIAMYGYHPGCAPRLNLRPVLTWKTAVVQIKQIYPGDTVSYNRRYTASSNRRIATIPVGYGDGFKRTMTGKAQVLIKGRRAPVVGAICMDQCMIDISDIEDVHLGDEVVLLGTQGDSSIWADEMARWADTISYEVLLCISDRVKRVYF